MPRPVQRPQQFSVAYVPKVACIAEARSAFSRWLEESGIPGTATGEMILVLDELMANAVDASNASNASHEPTGDVVVQAWADGDSLAVEVTNPPGAISPSVYGWNYEDPLRAGGRGLLIVEALVDDIAIKPPDGSDPLTVRCEWDLPTGN